MCRENKIVFIGILARNAIRFYRIVVIYFLQFNVKMFYYYETSITIPVPTLKLNEKQIAKFTPLSNPVTLGVGKYYRRIKFRRRNGFWSLIIKLQYTTDCKF